MVNLNDRLYIAVVSNIVLEPYFDPMAKQYFGENPVVFPIPFGEHIEAEYQTQLASANLIVVWLNLENLFELYFNAAKQNLDEAVALY